MAKSPKKQRNIQQTHAEREIIKTAPDLVVYLEGLPYVINPYIGENGTLINFNDYITDVGGSCGIDSYIPSANITLAIPNAHKRLFMAPGGNRILETMMDVRIFAKGYYPTPDGKTIYHRIFWGLISSVTYTDTGTSLQIELSCKGIMRLMEIMQVNQTPALVQTGDAENLTPHQTKYYNMNAFLAAFYMFVEPIQMSVMRKSSIKELGQQGTAGLGGSNEDEKASFYMGYAPKWSLYLKRLLKGLRFFPFQDEHKVDVFKKWAKNPGNMASLKAENYPEQVHIDLKDADFIKKNGEGFKELMSWAPDFAIGNISLFDSVIVSRLERLRQMVDLIGYEGFQDLDGRLIIKPPLYNLDVTKWADTGDEEEAPSNPFIIHLAEIEQESEQEDEGAVRVTRTQVKGTFGGNALMGAVSTTLCAVSSWTDINLMKKFGLRAEEPKTYSFLGEDTTTNFAWAVNEMTKNNKSYRTYQCSIPLRPELKLGYPIYLPHMDMYGYLNNISWSYNQGGAATMRLHLEAIRERVLLKSEETKEEQDPTTGEKKTRKLFVYKSIPNLVYKFTYAKTGTGAPKDAKDAADPRNATGAPVLPGTKEKEAEEAKALSEQKAKDLKKLMQLEPSTPNKAWRVQNGGVSEEEASAKNTGKRKYVDFSKPGVEIDEDYYFTLRTTVPYTDGKGYTVLAPFPWGRHMSLRSALEKFSMSSKERKAREEARKKRKDKKETAVPDFNEGKTQAKTNAFLFSALGTPSLGTSDANTWNSVFSGLLGVQKAVLGDDASTAATDDDQTWFVMDFTEGGEDKVFKAMQEGAKALVDAEKKEAAKSSNEAASATKKADEAKALVTGPGTIGK